MTETPGSTSDANVDIPQFESQLRDGRDRFLAHAIEHALSIGRRTPEDFIRFFPPQTIMRGLADAPEVRAQILVEATGIKERIAARKPWESAAEDLQIALSEGETNAEAVLWGFHPDDRVTYLNRADLWAFLVEGEFWNADQHSPEYALAKEHVAFLLERGLVDRVLTHRDIVQGLTLREISTRLPKVELGAIIDGALEAGSRGAPFTELELLTALPPSVLADYVPLPRVWNGVVVPMIAERHGFAEPVGSQSDRPAPAASHKKPPEDDDALIDEDDISEEDFATP